MKRLIQSLLLCCFMVAAVNVQAQSKTTTTIIVLRHAEKDTSKAGSQMMQSDPPLSEAGKARAEKLVTVLNKYAINNIYSTNYSRTKSTVTPLALQFGLEIQLYDPRNPRVLLDQLKTMEGKTIVVVGHSNTVPKLVNALAGTSYADLDESVYDQLYIVTITDGVAKVDVRTY